MKNDLAKINKILQTLSIVKNSSITFVYFQKWIGHQNISEILRIFIITSNLKDHFCSDKTMFFFIYILEDDLFQQSD